MPPLLFSSLDDRQKMAGKCRDAKLRPEGCGILFRLQLPTTLSPHQRFNHVTYYAYTLVLTSVVLTGNDVTSMG